MDIHCGGIDNAFPHHTNEIAQSESYIGHKWCNYWFHVHHLNTNHGKMSKSKGEFLTVSLLKEKGYDPLRYRLFCLQSHYRRGLLFSWENLDNAKTAYEKLVGRVAALKDTPVQPEDQDGMEALRRTFRAALDNDLNTSLAVTALYDVLKAKVSDGAKRALIGEFDQVLGLDLLAAAQKQQAEKAAPQEGDAEIDALVQARTDAKKAKNFAEADRIRDQLKEMGIVLVDSKEGTTWHR